MSDILIRFLLHRRHAFEEKQAYVNLDDLFVAFDSTIQTLEEGEFESAKLVLQEFRNHLLRIYQEALDVS